MNSCSPDHEDRRMMIDGHTNTWVGLGVYVILTYLCFDTVTCVTPQFSARIEGDVILGALFSIHHKPPSATAYSRTCGKIREHYGIQRVETVLMTLDEINDNDNILPGVILGCDIRDSCWYSAIALEQSIDFIKDAIASKTEPNGTSNGGNQSSECKDGNLQPIAGLIGPGSSEASIQVQNLLQIFNIPQIGYSATSMDLSNKLHKYFLRVVPPDNYQAQALVDIVLHFNWTYISTINSDGNYGVRGMQAFKAKAEERGICIATTNSVSSSGTDEEFDKVIQNLKSRPNASVVVCFCEGLTIKALLKAMERNDVEGKFLFIGSDGWGSRGDVVEGVEKLAAGGISVRLYSPPIPRFDDHYGKLRHDNNTRNPWFQEFWQERFNCYLPGDDSVPRKSTPCTGSETLEGSTQDSKLGFVVTAVYTLALALDRMQTALCGRETRGLCSQMKPINGTVLLQHILNVTFTTYSNETFSFDHKGDPPGRYDIVNYQRNISSGDNATYNYVTIGSWISGSLDMRENMFWPGKDHEKPVTSVCSLPCELGHVMQGKDIGCCWVCTPCKDNEIVRDNVTCMPCDRGWRPNFDLSECERIPIEFTSWSDTEAIVSMVMACICIVVTLWVFYVFVRHNDTPVVKASTRELSYIILLGTVLAYCCNFVLVAKPSMASCYLSRILPGLAFSLIYGALVTKTNRIARILEGSKRIMTKKPRFMSASAQVVITGIVIGVECVVITVMLIIEPADAHVDYSNNRVQLVCNISTLGVIVPLGFDVFLIFMCTLYAIKTRNLPENFNEAKFIGFTMYTTCVIWLGFFPIYFGGDSKVVTTCISITLSASVSLVLLFFPKVYVIVWSPERNTRGAFTTSRDVRCHIGSKSLPSCDSVDKKEKKYEGWFKSDIGRPPGSQQSDKPGVKRSSLPPSHASPQHRWFCTQRPSHIAEMQQSRRRCNPGPSKFRKQMSEDLDMLYLPALDTFQEEPCTPQVEVTLKKDVECQTELVNGCGLRHRASTDSSDYGGHKKVLACSPRCYSPVVHHFDNNPKTHERWPLLGLYSDEEGDPERGGDKEEEILDKGSDSDLSYLEDMQCLEAAVHGVDYKHRKDSPVKRLMSATPSEIHSLSPLSTPRDKISPFCVSPGSPSQPSTLSANGPPSLSAPCASTVTRPGFSAFSSQDSISGGDGTFHSLLSLTGSIASARTPEEVSVFSLSPLDTEERRMLDFQQYLQTRGLKLDMSSVQTSDL
ncbi:metabotropic glutamate receptor 1-like [Haliotis rubra]|uniref:metabotropic glutamate receptor 1-like n=1 Tax=Haliotis rubra TaxID=36100 RepID=UPI001EE57955|nr:metabotropic glutamate receptor 1-like [Haliotis rubra]XP_046583359.1 metabotropic glutamate receptor 1-like [Haliotis rubra]XP_046583360.1 metabotropic glutamate receptor 1-like [Haliotis rubra]